MTAGWQGAEPIPSGSIDSPARAMINDPSASLVTRLRALALYSRLQLADDAADEIARLRALVDDMQDLLDDIHDEHTCDSEWLETWDERYIALCRRRTLTGADQ